jgi:hypothetical protein
MRITIIQTIIVIDFPDTAPQPAPKPTKPLTLIEKLRKEAESGRDPKLWTPKDNFYGTFFT